MSLMACGFTLSAASRRTTDINPLSNEKSPVSEQILIWVELDSKPRRSPAKRFLASDEVSGPFDYPKNGCAFRDDMASEHFTVVLMVAPNAICRSTHDLAVVKNKD